MSECSSYPPHDLFNQITFKTHFPPAVSDLQMSLCSKKKKGRGGTSTNIFTSVLLLIEEFCLNKQTKTLTNVTWMSAQILVEKHGDKMK